MPKGKFLKKDDDGHWFLIPEEKIDIFNEWVDREAYPDQENIFDDYRIDNPHKIKIFEYIVL